MEGGALLLPVDPLKLSVKGRRLSTRVWRIELLVAALNICFETLSITVGPSCTEFVHLGIWHFDNDAISKFDDVLLEHGGLPHVLPLAVQLKSLLLVLPALELFILDAGSMMMMQQVRLMMFSLNMLDYPISFPSLST